MTIWPSSSSLRWGSGWYQRVHSTAKTADRLVAARAWISPWMVTVLDAYCGLLAIEVTMEPPVTEGG
jgi:hypothetical protein